VRIETSARIDAPPEVVFRFYGWLDYLRFVSADLRQEWCPEFGVAVSEGGEYEIRLRQGRHAFTLRFRTIKVIDNELYEDEFLNWTVKGGRHLQSFRRENGATVVTDTNIWSPPWYARAIVARHREAQTGVFQERLDRAKRIIEAVYRSKQERAFIDGIFDDAGDAGFSPVVAADERSE
jgi:hypothetical protein